MKSTPAKAGMQVPSERNGKRRRKCSKATGPWPVEHALCRLVPGAAKRLTSNCPGVPGFVGKSDERPPPDARKGNRRRVPGERRVPDLGLEVHHERSLEQVDWPGRRPEISVTTVPGNDRSQRCVFGAVRRSGATP